MVQIKSQFLMRNIERFQTILFGTTVMMKTKNWQLILIWMTRNVIGIGTCNYLFLLYNSVEYSKQPKVEYIQRINYFDFGDHPNGI